MMVTMSLLTGGRKAGTPNRKTGEIGELLDSLGHNPIKAMVRISDRPQWPALSFGAGLRPNFTFMRSAKPLARGVCCDLD